MRLTFCFIAAGVAACATAGADTITVDGRIFSGVYVRTSAVTYYIHDPVDGKTIAVPRAEVDPADLKISADGAERQAILETWKAKHMTTRSPRPVVLSYDSWKSSLSETVPDAASAQGNEPKQARITSAPERSRAGTVLTNVRDRGRRSKFVDSSGVSTLTNRPGMFRDDPEYVEVVLQFEHIVVPAELATPAKTPQDIEGIVHHYATQYNLDPGLVIAVIRQESNFNPRAVSHAGASGLMQLMPGTALEMGVTDIFDPAQNIAGGTQYLAKMLELFNGDITLALAGYNAGPGNVKKYRGVPPFKETQDYIRRVMSHHKRYDKGAGSVVLTAAPASSVATKHEHGEEACNHHRLVLKNQWTLHAESVLDKGDYYLVVAEGVSQRINKGDVRSIDRAT